MRGMKLTVVGCSPAWPNPGGAQSGYLVEGEGRLLLDCGPGVLARLRAKSGWPQVDALVITHFHLDHWGDLVPWAFGARFGPGRDAPQVALWLPPGGLDTVRAFETTLGAGAILDVFDAREYDAGRPFEAAGFEVTPVRMAHYTQLTFGMRVTNSTRTLAYSGDSGPSDALAELARDADLFVCEATLAQPEPAMRGHLTEEEALEAHRASGAKRLLVVHRPEELPLSEGVERAYDGYEISL
jgi:ribonuclease BN (tRNA processing enzyme)